MAISQALALAGTHQVLYRTVYSTSNLRVDDGGRGANTPANTTSRGLQVDHSAEHARTRLVKGPPRSLMSRFISEADDPLLTVSRALPSTSFPCARTCNLDD
jgi:hypothetical protein